MDNIIEPSGVYVRNLNVNTQNVATLSNGEYINNWSTASSAYYFYTIPYEKSLMLDHYYYVGFTYKFTTTNQSPTWVQQYMQSGSHSTPARILTPTAGQEYSTTGICQAVSSGLSLDISYIYNGNSNAISGVQSQAKNVFVYDVTEIYSLLQVYGLVSNTTQLKTWCDNNIKYTPRYVNQQLTITPKTKVFIKDGDMIADEFVEPSGLGEIGYSNFSDYCYFDNKKSKINIYNNKGNGTVTHSYITSSSVDSPFKDEHAYCLQITTNGEATPEAGGLVPNTLSSAANKVYLERFVAKIPVGYTVIAHNNSFGTGGTKTFLTTNKGTGAWQEYVVKWTCGSTGTFSSIGHVALNGSDNTSVTWYVAYFNIYDITNHPDITNADEAITYIKNGTITSKYFQTGGGENILRYDQEKDESYLPKGWKYDTTDVAGNGTISIVQPNGAAQGTFGEIIPIVPTSRYKISAWIKVTGSVYFYLALAYYTTLEDAQKNTNVISHTNVGYRTGTYTYLAKDVNNGDTVIYLKSAANWNTNTLNGVGLRSYMKSYNNLATFKPSNSCITAVDKTNNTITLSQAWNKGTFSAGTVAVECFDSSTFPYPIASSALNTNDTWKQFTGYFGNNNLYYGEGGNWGGIPADIRYMRIIPRLRANSSGADIKWCDIQITNDSPSFERNDDKIFI